MLYKHKTTGYFQSHIRHEISVLNLLNYLNHVKVIALVWFWFMLLLRFCYTADNLRLQNIIVS